MFKKVLSIALVFTMLLATGMLFTSCAGNKAEIALITDKGNIDDKSFNQGAWEGVVEFAKANNVSHKYYKPEEASDAGYLASIELAITKGGAKVVVTPGYLFEVAVYEAQTKFPEVKFILLDGAPHSPYGDDTKFETKSNVASVMYAEEQSGYLAGYAAVKDGFTKLGFMGGMAVPAVQAFGYGYLQGANAAANELGVNVEVKYHYTGNFEENDTNKATAKTMFEGGTEVIFACGGSVGKSVMSAASEAKKYVIGVDVDQRYDSETVITSAVKGLGASVIQVLESIYKTNDFEAKFGGKTTYFNAANNGVGLPTTVIGQANGNAFDRFKSFSKADYDVQFNKLVKGEISLLRTINVAAETGYATADELVKGLGLNKVTVITVQ